MKNRFARLSHGGHLGFAMRRFYFFCLQVNLMLPSKFRVIWPFGSGEEVKKKIFKMAAIAAVLDFRSERL